MKHNLLILLTVLSQVLLANNFEAYPQHTATDRLLIMFNSGVTAQQQAEVIAASQLVTSFYPVPSPSLTVCFSNHTAQAMKYFAKHPQVSFVSFFLTDGKHYAGVLNRFFVKLKDKDFEPLLKEKLQQYNLGEAKANKYIPNLYQVQNTNYETRNTVDWCAELLKEGWCQYASPDYLVNPEVCAADPLFTRQWSIKNEGTFLQGSGTADADMDVDTAWSITTGDPNIKVGIIDSGVDTLHEDLVANILPGHDAVSDSTDGYPTPAFPEDGHGTCCAGIVAALKDNGKGGTGVAPSCKIIPVRSFYYISPGGGSPLPISTAAAFADAIGWACNSGADILSNSWGLPDGLIGLLPGGMQPVDDAIQTAYTTARGGKGIAMFFSSGNDNDSVAGPIWPSKLSQTIAVNATSMCDERKSPDDCSGEDWGGNFAGSLDFSAPGVRVATTDMIGTKGFVSTGYYYLFNGTSAACPNAAAVGALLLSIRPDLYAEDVRKIIARTCDKVGGYNYSTGYVNGTWSRELGYGRVNALAALQYAETYSSVNNMDDVVNINVFPNPSNGLLNIDMENERGMLRLYNMAGAEIIHETVEKGMNVKNIETLIQGMYLVQVLTPKGIVTRKITLLK